MTPPPLAIGLVAGFLGAIPPGPVGMAMASHATAGRARQAALVGLGAACVDTMLSGAVALGAGPLLARATEPLIVRVFLALAYAVLGVMLVAEALVTRKPPPKPRASASSFLGGALRGIANPALAANWAMFVAGLTAARLYIPSPLGAVSFAVGVGVGVASYFVLFARAVGSAQGARLAPWLRAIGGLTGLALVVGAARALVG